MKRLDYLFALVIACTFLLAASAHGTTIYEAGHDYSLYGHLSQYDMKCGANGCGPTAATNSLLYLQNAHPYGADLVMDTTLDLNGDSVSDEYDDLIATANALSDCMLCTTPPLGVTINDFRNCKQAWIESMSPGQTRYGFATWPTWNFLYSELLASEDIELWLNWNGGGAHFVTLTSFSFVDTDSDGVIGIGENAQIDFIDPLTGNLTYASISQLDGMLGFNYASGEPGLAGNIGYAVTESYVPEPGTATLVGFGLLQLVSMARRSTRRS